MATIAEALALAVRHHQAGELQQARQIYTQILQVQPQQVDALHLLGLICHQTGSHAQAIDYIAQAIRLKPDFVEAHFNLANAFQQHGQLEQAVASYQQALRFKPDYVEAHYNLANALRDLGRLDEAVACYQQALRLRPDYARAHSNLGSVHLERGQAEQAVASFREVVRINPGSARAHSNLANALCKLGRLAEAEAHHEQAQRIAPAAPDDEQSRQALALARQGSTFSERGEWDRAVFNFRQALQLKPEFAPAQVNLGVALAALGKFDEAVASYEEALRLSPDWAEALTNLGSALTSLGKPDRAVAVLRRAADLNPGLSQVHNNLGTALSAMGKLDEAATSYHRALAISPDDPELHYNLGTCLIQQGKRELAQECLQRAIQLKPDHAESHHNLAYIWLSKGDFERGWPEYEWRWKCKEFRQPRFPQPVWDGSSLVGKTILLLAEQGLGDTIQFVRYAALVKQRGGTVLLHTPRTLLPLLSSCPGIDRLVAYGEPLPGFDTYASLMSLPGILGTRLDTVPANVPYLFADPQRMEHWQRELSSLAGFKIGICWQGNPGYRWDHLRSFPLEVLAPVAVIENVQLISLQKGPGSEQIAEVADRFPVLDLGKTLDETSGPFLDTAAVLKTLDLVITCDTAVGHLAGALGVPVWLALAVASEWRWLLDRDDTPWYPNTRLLRQKEVGNWPEVFERMAQALRQKLAARSAIRSIQVEIAPGELIDKITILEIKRERITDAAKLQNVQTELTALATARDQSIPPSPDLARLTAELKAVNERLWDVEDELRVCESRGDFSPRFIELARSVYQLNDRRAAIKRQINELLGSRYVEEKSYVAYQ